MFATFRDSLLTLFAELPCRNCQLANQECTYPMRDRNVTVSERFIRNLEARALSHSSQLPQATPSSEPESLRGTVSQGLPPPLPLVEDSTSEVFLARLKQIRQNNTGPDFSQLTPSNPYTDDTSPAAAPYDFVQLKFDNSGSLAPLLPPAQSDVVINWCQTLRVPSGCLHIRMHAHCWTNSTYSWATTGIGFFEKVSERGLI